MAAASSRHQLKDSNLCKMKHFGDQGEKQRRWQLPKGSGCGWALHGHHLLLPKGQHVLLGCRTPRHSLRAEPGHGKPQERGTACQGLQAPRQGHAGSPKVMDSQGLCQVSSWFSPLGRAGGSPGNWTQPPPQAKALQQHRLLKTQRSQRPATVPGQQEEHRALARSWGSFWGTGHEAERATPQQEKKGRQRLLGSGTLLAPLPIAPRCPSWVWTALVLAGSKVLAWGG